MVCDTPPSQDAFTHQIWNSYLIEYRRYAPDTMQFLETRSEVKVTVTQLWYATLSHHKTHLNTKFEIPTSNNIRDMLRTRDGRTDSAITTCLPKFLWGHKNKTSRVGPPLTNFLDPGMIAGVDHYKNPS